MQQPLSVEIYCRDLGTATHDQLQALMPAPVTVLVDERPPDLEALAAPLAQSWQLPEREEILAGCRYVITIRETLVSPVGPQERLKLVQQGVAAALEAVHGEALHCIDAQQIIPPGLFIGETEAHGLPCLQAGAINVRLFRVDGDERGDGRMVMDTMGLAAFGLPDLQIDYRWLDPGQVAATLFAAAGYLFKEGDVVAAGHAIEGSLPGSAWTVRRERSIVEPHREVIDLDPGAPYSSRKPEDE